MNSSEAQKEAVRRFGPMGSIVQHYNGAANPCWVGTALSHGATFTFLCMGKGDSWESAFADAAVRRPEPFHTPTKGREAMTQPPSPPPSPLRCPFCGSVRLIRCNSAEPSSQYRCLSCHKYVTQEEAEKHTEDKAK